MSKVDESCVHSWSLVPLAEVFCVQAGVGEGCQVHCPKIAGNRWVAEGG